MIFKFQSQKRGFSLTEVLLAIAIVAIAMVPLVALIPISLKRAQLSTEETHAVHLLAAFVQDLRYTQAERSESEIFKVTSLPFKGATANQKNMVWVDSCWATYPADQKPNGFCYQIEWTYASIPDPASFLPIEATIIVRWPPNPNSSSKSGGEVSSPASFRKPS